MKKLLGYLLTPLHYIAFGLILLIFHPIQWISFNLFGYKAHKAAVDILNWFLTSSYYLLGNTVTFINKQDLPVGRSIIFLANHQSTYDIPPLIYYLRKYHSKFISKIELTKGIPSISYNLKVGGGANIDRANPRQSITELSNLGTRMKEKNWSTVIFPEGTRSKDGQVRTFQAAGIATILKKCPDALLVPVAISNSWKMVQYGAYPLGTFTAMRWEVLAPIEPGGQPIADLVLLAENRIKEALEVSY
jgi:1-acyl-sn-glycerol-3-phosphate acyltransferase